MARLLDALTRGWDWPSPRCHDISADSRCSLTIAEGRAADIGFVYDSVEAHPATPLTPEALRIVLPKICGDAVWLNAETIVQSVLDLTLAPSRSRRMWLNEIVAEERRPLQPRRLGAAARRRRDARTGR